jgi:hypothetical protein
VVDAGDVVGGNGSCDTNSSVVSTGDVVGGNGSCDTNVSVVDSDTGVSSARTSFATSVTMRDV